MCVIDIIVTSLYLCNPVSLALLNILFSCLLTLNMYYSGSKNIHAWAVKRKVASRHHGGTFDEFVKVVFILPHWLCGGGKSVSSLPSLCLLSASSSPWLCGGARQEHLTSASSLLSLSPWLGGAPHLCLTSASTLTRISLERCGFSNEANFHNITM